MSPAMQALERVVAEIAPTDIAVLVVGEGGTGKGALAADIHRLSKRQGQPFVVIPSRHVAPTWGRLSTLTNGGDSNWKRHFFSQGTVCLDEVTDLDSEAQELVLELLADGNQPATSRLICSSRCNLEEEVHRGRFREDLYYRISGVCLRLPPLRHRKEDIPNLAEYFLAKYAALFGRAPMNLVPETLETLMAYSWPGNVRELENVLKSAAAVGNGEMAIAALRIPGAAIETTQDTHPRMSLKQAARAASLQAERELLLQVLSRTRWNRKRAAKELQISYKALLYKLKQTGLDNRELSRALGGTDS
jgi:two-component system response regulator AtoC